MNFLISLPSSLSCCIIDQWTELKGLARLDSAFCVENFRSILLDLFSSAECVIESEINASHYGLLSWLLKRKVKIASFLISRFACKKLGAQYMKMLGSQVTQLVRDPDRYMIESEAEDYDESIFEQACAFGNLTCVECPDMSIPLLNEILSRNPHLQELKFSVSWREEGNISMNGLLPQMTHLTPWYASLQIVMHIISLCPNLQTVTLPKTNICGFTDSDLLTIARQCRQLKALSLAWMTSPAHIYTQMSEMCPKIQSLSLASIPVTDNALEIIAVNLKHLRRLKLDSCGELTDASLHSLEQHSASTLQLLWFSNTTHITTDAIIQLQENLPTLHVHYYVYAFNADPVPHTAYSLCRTLKLYITRFHDVVPIIAQCKLLQVLILLNGGEWWENPQIPSAAMLREIISCCPQLHTIALCGGAVYKTTKLVTSIGSRIAVVHYDTRKNGLEHFI